MRRLFAKKPRYRDELLQLDYLVYSPHKTGTQTLITTLNSNGYTSTHCHLLGNIGVRVQDFTIYLQDYRKRNKRPLDIITVFREPMERHMSSFFQGYGTRPLRLKQMQDESETIIYRYTIEELREKYIQELTDKSLIGYPEALHEIFSTLRLTAADLSRAADEAFARYESDLLRLYVFRFDELFANLEPQLSAVTEKAIQEASTNLSDTKWYRDKYKAFKTEVRLPDEVIEQVYEEKRDLIEYFYGDYPGTLQAALVKFGNGGT